MLSFFGPGCSLYGPLAQDAAQSVNKLIDALKAIANDEDCKSVVSAVSNLQTTANQIAGLQDRNSYNDREIFGLESKKRELFFLLGQTDSTSSEASLLQSEIRETQLAIAKNQGYRKADQQNDAQKRRAQATTAILGTTRALMDQMANNQGCWQKHKNLLQEVAGFGAAVGQSAALDVATGGIALAVGAGVSLAANVIDTIHKYTQQQPINKAAEILEPSAVFCAAEALANQYCAAQDVLGAVRLVAKALTEAPQDEIWSGVRLLEREIPNLTNWLEIVRAGAPASTSGAASSRQLIDAKEAILTSSLSMANAAVNEGLRLFGAIQEPDSGKKTQLQWQIEKKVIANLLMIASSNISISGGNSSISATNPMGDIYIHGLRAYKLLGVPDGVIPKDAFGNPKDWTTFDPFSFPDWPQGYKFSPDLEILHKNFSTWRQLALDTFSLEKNTIRFDDPLLIFNQAYPKFYKGQQKGISTRRSLDVINTFLQSHQPSYFADTALQAQYQDTIDRLTAIGNSIDHVLIKKGDPLVELGTVSKSAGLENGTDFLRNRIYFYVRLVLEDLVLQHQGISNAIAIQLLAADDVVRELKSISGRTNLKQIETDAKNAKSIIKRTLLRYYQSFDSNIADSLSDWDQLAATFKENPADGPTWDTKAVACLNLLSSPHWDEKLSLDRCIGAQLSSVFPAGPKSVAFEKKLFDLSFDQRVCSFRDFSRREAVFQSLAEQGKMLDWENKKHQALFVKNLVSSPPSTEVSSIALECQSAEAWQTETNSYCEQDWWDGCDRSYAMTCKKKKKKSIFD